MTETKAASLAQEVVKAGQRTDPQRLVSLIDSVVQQLVLHTLGGVVTPAHPLMIIVLQDHPVEVEAQRKNKDAGFVKEGQPVEIQEAPFPFTLHGTIPGTVLSVSDGAAPVGKIGLGAPGTGKPGPSDDPGRRQTGPSPVRHSGDCGDQDWSAGMIESLLSPLLKSGNESLRKR